MLKLSICIPTYNRAKYLKQCLDYLLPQVKEIDDVEVVIIDNFSSDNTESICREHLVKNVRYFRNAQNLGYAGNQIKCIEYANGKYIAILCDDDVYTDGIIKKILSVIEKSEYAFIALNYYSYRGDVNIPHITDFAPAKDVVFSRAYDVMNYPSVGHFSGFIFNSELAKPTLTKMLFRNPLSYYEKHRGVIADLALRTTLASKLQSYFIGEQKLAVHDPEKVDYDALKHNCLDYYEYYKGVYDEGLISFEDLAYRRKLVISWLIFAIAKDSHLSSNREIRGMTEKFKSYFSGEMRFIFFIYPVLLLGSFSPVRRMYHILFDLRQALRKIKEYLIDLWDSIR